MDSEGSEGHYLDTYFLIVIAREQRWLLTWPVAQGDGVQKATMVQPVDLSFPKKQHRQQGDEDGAALHDAGCSVQLGGGSEG